jgi:hypothetical protein
MDPVPITIFSMLTFEALAALAALGFLRLRQSRMKRTRQRLTRSLQSAVRGQLWAA